MPAFMIAAAHKSSGKTTISIGLAAALKARGLNIQTFKKGPDYIDPMWLRAGSGQACYNLDFNTMKEEEIIALYAKKSSGKDIILVEANKGLFDGLNIDGSDSNAQLAKILKVPVILVIDCKGMTRGIAPLLLGYQSFDEKINIAGIILNKVGGERHEQKLRAAVKKYTDFAILGAIREDNKLDIGERHLGLTTPNECGQKRQKINYIEKIIKNSLDLDEIIKMANRAKEKRERGGGKIIVGAPKIKAKQDLTIAIAKDKAFGFYYEDDLESFAKYGAKLVEFDCLNDEDLPPNIDALFIGGGFPEMFMRDLSKNISLRAKIKAAINSGLPSYAECGGLIYLCKKIEYDGKSRDMVGVINAIAKMHNKPIGRGYVIFENNNNHLWESGGERIKAHEFHYSGLENLPRNTKFARKIERGYAIDGQNDAIIINNLLAGFCHLRNSENHQWVKYFTDFVRAKKTF